VVTVRDLAIEVFPNNSVHQLAVTAIVITALIIPKSVKFLSHRAHPI
jgi:hypothetical protein